MQIINRGIMFVTLSEAKGNSMGNPEDWADSLAKRKQAKQDDEIRKAEFTAMNRKIEEEGMPQLWGELIAEFDRHCKVFNERVQPERELACHRMSSNRFMVRPDALPEIIVGEYDPQIKRITITTHQRQEIFSGVVKHEIAGTGKMELRSWQTQNIVTVEEIVRRAIEAGTL